MKKFSGLPAGGIHGQTGPISLHLGLQVLGQNGQQDFAPYGSHQPLLLSSPSPPGSQIEPLRLRDFAQSSWDYLTQAKPGNVLGLFPLFYFSSVSQQPWWTLVYTATGSWDYSAFRRSNWFVVYLQIL